MDKSGTNGIHDLFNSLNYFLIILPPDPDVDTTVAALSLHHALKNNNKKSQIGYSGSLPDLTGVTGAEDLKDSIGSKNLHINLNFLEKDLEKVDYVVDHLGKFSLVIQPKAGNPAPDTSQINYNYSGAEADLVILFSVNSLEELGALYAQEKHFLDNASKLLITNSTKECNFTNHLIQSPNIGFSEIVAEILKKSDIKINSQTANNLLEAIYKVTESLKNSRVRPETFEIMAFLMRSGARLPGAASIPTFPKSSFPQPPFFLKPPSEADTEKPEDSELQSPVPTDWQMPKIFKASSTQ